MTLRALLLAALLPSAALAGPRSEAFLDLASRLPADVLDGSEAPAFSQLHFADHEAAGEIMAALPTPPAHVAEYGAWARLFTPLYGGAMLDGITGAWEPVVGFNPPDIRQSLLIETAEGNGVLLRLAPEAAGRVAPALEATGYAREERDGIAALARGEDGAIAPEERNWADPFGNGLGASSRVVVEGDLVTQADAWEPLLALLGAEPQGHPALPALAAAIDDPRWGGAGLVQARIWADQDNLGQAGDGVGLPTWDLAVLADLAEGTSTLTLFLFAYPDRASAEAAAQAIRDGWSTLDDVSGATMQDNTGSPISSLAVLGDGPFVTALALAAPSDLLRGDWPVNRPFQRLIDTYAHRGLELFGPL